MKIHFGHRGQAYTIELQSGAESIDALVDGAQFSVQLLGREEGAITFRLDGQAQQALWINDGLQFWLHLDGRSYLLERMAGKSSSDSAEAGGENILRAPMPGQVIDLLVEAGDSVAAGEVLLVLEAMKMELRIQAPKAGEIVELPIAKGDSVEKDQILVEIGAEDN